MELGFRLATPGDLPAMAAIHKRAYSRAHFTSLLSEATLVNYYGLFIDDGAETCVAFDRCRPDEILGFAVYGERIAERIAVFKRTQRGAIVGTSIRHPLAAAGKALGRLRAIFAQTSGDAAPAAFLLLSIAVGSRGAGIGKALLAELLKAGARAEGGRIGLYVNSDNITAINAYFQSGFRLKSLMSNQYYMEIDLRRLRLERS